MRRKNLISQKTLSRRAMTALMCSVCLAASAAPFGALAAETEVETEAETETVILERPEYTASEYVILGEYKGLNVTTTVGVTDEEIQEEIEYYISQADVMDEITEGTVENGDIANIDFEGKKDGVAFDGGTSKGYDLTIGSGTFIDGFEEGLVGVAIGDTVDLNLTFPENYGSEELAGQDVVFTVTVNYVQRAPELTDDLVNTISDGAYTTVDDYREYIRQELQEYQDTYRESQLKSDLLTLVANNSEITGYPQEMIDYGLSNMRAYYESYAAYYSMEFEDFLSTYFGMTEEQFEEAATLSIQESLQQELYLKAIAEAENMELSDEEYAEAAQNFADNYGYDSVDDLVADYGEATVRISALQNKVLDFLLENAVVEEIEAGAEEAETEA